MSDTPAPATSARLSLSAKAITWTLAIMALVLALLGFGAHMASEREDLDLLWPFARQFDFGQEGNFVNWYQSVTLLACAALPGAIALLKKCAGAPRVGHWAVMAAVMAFVAMDEAAQVHEQTINAFVGALADSGDAKPADHGGGDVDQDPLGGATWMFLYLPAAAVLGAFYFRFFLALPPRTRWGFIGAAALYLGGAVGVEMIYERTAGIDGGETPLSWSLDTGSELGEMLGVAVFAGTLAAYIAREHGALRVEFRAKD